jgi:allantoin racemase
VIADAIAPYTSEALKVDVVSPEKGTVGLESYYHNYLASVQVHKRIVEAEKEGYDGIVIACYGDPGIEAAKELVNIPVVGITEASYALARILCTKFLVVLSAETAARAASFPREGVSNPRLLGRSSTRGDSSARDPYRLLKA